MTKKYQVDGYFSFEILSNSPGEVKNFIYKVLDKEGLNNKNFDISILRVNSKGEVINEINNEENPIKSQKAVKENKKIRRKKK